MRGKNFVPKKYQIKAIKFMLSKAVAGLFLAPGLGKTIITLKVMEFLLKKGIISNALIVAKLRICYGPWPKEVLKWDMPFKIAMLHGPHKDSEFDKDVEMYLINYEGLPWLEGKLKGRNKHKFDMLVFDESSKLKNTKTQRFKIVKRIAPLFSRRYILTGSPAPNGLRNLFGQIYALDLGKTFGKYVTKFLLRYFYPAGYMGYEWKLQPGMEKEIYAKLKGLVLRFGKEELKLPPLHKVNREVYLSEEVMKKYKELEVEFITELEMSVITASNAATRSSKLRQMAGGSLYDTNKNVIDIHDEKIEEVIEIVEELQGSPCIISYEYKHELDKLQKAFPEAPYIGGGVSAKKGSEIEDRWNRGEIPVLLGNPESIAHGLNLQESGCTIIMYSLTWDLENYEQLIQRLWRQGQKNPVTVFHIIAKGTVDEAVLKALKGKDLVQQNLLDALKSYYLGDTVIMSEKETILLFKEVVERTGHTMPEYAKGDIKSFALWIKHAMHSWSHDEHLRFIKDTTGDDRHEQELSLLFKKSKTIVFGAFGIIESLGGEYKVKRDTLIRKYASKLVKKSTPPPEMEDYLNIDKQSNKEKDMTTSKFAPSKKKVSKKKTTASKKKTVAKKKTTASKKKTVAKKKTTASKKKTVSRKSSSSSDISNKKITKIENTARKGTIRHALMEAIMKCKTVEQAVGKEYTFEGEKRKIATIDIRVAENIGCVKLS